MHHAGSILPTLSEENCNFGGLNSKSRFSYRFILSNSSRVFNLAADTEEAMTTWIEELKKATLPSHGSTENVFTDDSQALSSAYLQEAPTGEVGHRFSRHRSYFIAHIPCDD